MATKVDGLHFIKPGVPIEGNGTCASMEPGSAKCPPW
jgi:hypothetical protein